MFKGLMTIAIGVFSVTSAYAQEPARSDADARARQKQQIGVMEGALVQAVSTGANHLVTQSSRRFTQAATQGMLLGSPQAAGVWLTDGPVFAVRVPGMRGTIQWAAPMLVERERRSAEAAQPTVQAATVSDTAPAPVAPPPVSPVDDVLRDPQAAYVREIRAALIDAMLESGTVLRVGPSQSLTVFARRDTNPNPLDPTDEVRTLIFTVKGSDLESYRTGRITIEEARQLVAVRED